jgi:hypothetical protein
MRGLYHVGSLWPSKLAGTIWHLGRAESDVSERFVALRRELTEQWSTRSLIAAQANGRL